MGRKELAKYGYVPSDMQREIVVVVSSFETNTCILHSLKDLRKPMSVIRSSPKGTLNTLPFFASSSCMMKYRQKSLRRQLRHNFLRAFIPSDPFANLQKISPTLILSGAAAADIVILARLHCDRV